MKEGWTYKKLGEVCVKITDGSHNPPKGVVRSNNIMLSSQNVQNGFLDMSSVRYLSDADFMFENQRTKASKGDVLLTIVGTIGRTCVLKGDEGNITFQRSVAILKPSKEILSYYLMYYLLSQSSRLNTKAQGAAQKGIYLKQLGAYDISYPSIEEQQRIVSRLDAAFAHIDELKSNAEKQLSEARVLFQKALTKAMEPKEGWEEKKLGEVCDIFGRIGFRGYTTKDLVPSAKEGAISLSPSNIQDGQMDYSKCTYISWFKYDESPEIKIYNGDILLVKTGSSYGKSALVENLPHEATINPQSVVLKNTKINTRFFAYQIRTNRVLEEFDKFVSGTAIPTFSQTKLSTVPILFPSEKEQQYIVSRLDAVSAHIRELEEVLQKTISECDALKQALLRKVFE